MKRYMPDFYEKKCFKKNNVGHFCSCGKKVRNTSKKCGECAKILKTKRPAKEILIKDLSMLRTKEVCEKYNIKRSRLCAWKKKYLL